MGTLVIFTLALFVVPSTALAVNVSQLCQDDDDCDTAEYCHKDSNTCTMCTDCSQWNRRGSPGCVKESKQCGPCLAGYEAEELSDQTVRDLCVPTVKTELDDDESTISWMVYLLTPTFCIGVLVAFIVVWNLCKWERLSTFRMRLLVRLGIYPRDNGCDKHNRQQSAGMESPNFCSGPLYLVPSPSAPPAYSIVDEETQPIHQRECENLSQAQVSNPPQWVRHNDVEVENDEQEDGADEVDAPPQPIDIDLVDEAYHQDDTIASTWSPSPNGDPSSLVTSFAGLFSSENSQDQSANHSAVADSAGQSSQDDEIPQQQQQQQNQQNENYYTNYNSFVNITINNVFDGGQR